VLFSDEKYNWDQNYLGFLVFNATFNNISAISVSFIGGENHRASHIDYTSPQQGSIDVEIDTDCIGSYKSNYHMTTMAPNY
jgi:hypothetical protein